MYNVFQNYYCPISRKKEKAMTFLRQKKDKTLNFQETKEL